MLPNQLTSFVGREKEQTELQELFKKTRLLTLTGVGGCGKTRLALQIAGGLRDAFPDGVWLVELASLADPALVPQTVAAVFDLRPAANLAPIDLVKNFLRARNLLLVLDNCEHLIHACAELSDTLLRACTDLKILTTSREALNIAGETTFHVPSLSLPDLDHLPPLETLAQSESVRLFVERASAVQPHFQLTNKNGPAIAQIVHRLDGIPLAIELAAARVRSLGVEQIAARLGDLFQLLTGGSRTALPRHQTLRAAMDWSYESLTEPERALFRRLGVFVGDWTLEAVEFVASDGYNVLDIHSRLIDKSLVLARETDEDGTRYHLLEPLRQYADAKLAESGEADHLRARHLDFFLRFAEEASSQFHSAEQLKLLDRRRSEYENLRVALQWASAGGSPIASSIDRPQRIVGALDHLGDVYQFRGVGTQAITFYQEAIAWCERLAVADKISVLRLHGKIVETASSLNWRVALSRFEAVNQISVASLAFLQAELNTSLAPHPQIVHLLMLLSRAAWADPAAPDWDTAERYAHAAVDLAEKLDIPVELSTALRAISEVYFARGLLRERVQVAFRRLELARDPCFSNVLERVIILKDLGNALETVGEYTVALLHLKEAASLAEQIGAVYQQRALLAHSAYCLFRLDRWDEILAILDKVREIQNRYPRERAGPECFPIAIAASVHARCGEADLGAAERAEADSIMTSVAGPLDRWARAQIH